MRKLLLTLLPLCMLLLFVPAVSAADTEIRCEPPRIVQTIGDPGTIQVSGSTVAVNETEEEVPVSVVLAFYTGEQTGAELVRCQVESMMLLPGTHTLSVSEEGIEGERVKCFVMNPQTMAPLGKASEAVVSQENQADFGLVYGYEVDEQSQLLRLSVFTSGEHVTYLAAPSVRIDGTDYASGAEVKELLETVFPSEEDVYWNDGGPGGFSMLFLLDENGQISYIDTPVQGENEADYTLRSIGDSDIGFHDYKYISGENEGYITLESNIKRYINNDAAVLHAEGARGSYLKYYSYTAGQMVSSKVYDMQILTTKGSSLLKETANYIVARGYPADSAATAIHDRQMIVVSSVSRIMDEYGRETIMISGLQEGMEKDFYVDYDYYKTDLYKDVWAFGQGGIFSQYYNPSTGEYAEGIAESEERKRSIFLPGDVIRVETHAVTGNVIRVTPTFLSDAKVFKADDEGTMLMTRYRAFDLAVVNQIEEELAGFTYLVDKNTYIGSKATASIHVNEDGYVISSENSLGEINRLYDETAGVYLFDDKTGMRNDEIIDVTGFKVMVYDTSQAEHHRVYAGDWSDLCDTATEGEPASLVIMQFRSNNPRGMVILKL